VGRLSDYVKEHVNEAPSEATGFGELPLKKWLLLRTVPEGRTGEPEVVQLEGGSHKLQLTFMVIGGEPGTESGRGAYLWRAGFFINEFEGSGIHPRLVGILNALFSPGVGEGMDKEERKNARWDHTLQALDEAADELGIDPSAYPDPILALAGIAAKALGKRPRTIIGKARTNRRDFVDLSSYEDDTPENREKRNIQVYFSPEELGDEAAAF